MHKVAIAYGCREIHFALLSVSVRVYVCQYYKSVVLCCLVSILHKSVVLCCLVLSLHLVLPRVFLSCFVVSPWALELGVCCRVWLRSLVAGEWYGIPRSRNTVPVNTENSTSNT
jgi:hypothetical protein